MYIYICIYLQMCIDSDPNVYPVHVCTVAYTSVGRGVILIAHDASHGALVARLQGSCFLCLRRA